jgi:DNA-binding transcriptional LysR family regulator
MDRFLAMELFVAVVDQGSFAGAAEQLGVSRNMASRHVADLEAHLGTRLLNRTTRSVSLTSTGAEYLEQARDVLTRLYAAEASAGAEAHAPRGRLAVSAPMSFGVRQIAPYLPDFVAANPEVSVEINFNDRQVDLVEEGFDIAVRIADLPDSSLISKKVADVELVLCASPDYLAAHGTPEAPDDLGRHRLLGYSLATDPGVWRLAGSDGQKIRMKVDPVLACNSGDALAAIAAAGGGITLQPDFIVNPEISAGNLVRILPAWSGARLGVHVVHASRRFQPLKVRSFIEWITKIYRPRPPWTK